MPAAEASQRRNRNEPHTNRREEHAHECHPPPSRNIVAYLALFVALGGTSYAAWLAPPNSVNSRAIIDGQVKTPDLAPNVISADEFCLMGSCAGSKEIANNAVSSGELASGAVGTFKVADHAITTSKLAPGAVGSGQLATGAVGNANLATDAVTGDKVKDGSLTAADIAGGIPPSDAYIARKDFASISGTGATVVSLNLPAGYYTLTAETAIVNMDTDPQLADCTLSTGATTEVNIPGIADAYEQSVTVEDLLTLTAPGTASLHCHTYFGQTNNAKLIAVKVAALHG